MERYSDAQHGGFPTLDKAKEYMAEQGVNDYSVIYGTCNPSNGQVPRKGEKGIYCVANGNQPGQFTDYEYSFHVAPNPDQASDEVYSTGVKAQVDKHSGNCHKVFKTREAAIGFQNDYNGMQRLLKDKQEVSPDDIALQMGLLKIEDAENPAEKEGTGPKPVERDEKHKIIVRITVYKA